MTRGSARGAVVTHQDLVGCEQLQRAAATSLLACAGFTYRAPMQRFFETSDLDIGTWGVIALASALVIVLVKPRRRCYEDPGAIRATLPRQPPNQRQQRLFWTHAWDHWTIVLDWKPTFG
jgi:hypothetical protein